MKPSHGRRVPRPILKWPGGKTQLLSELAQHISSTQGTYWEPFIGGGAMFFALVGTHRFGRAVIGDLNPELTGLYRVVRDHVQELVEGLEALAATPDWNTAEYFQKMRASEPSGDIERAVRIIYLNKTAFNGLYRVNRAGKFNAPFGRYKSPALYELANLRACSQALQGVAILTGDFEQVLCDAREHDVVYLDPPYVPLTNTSSFTAYAGRFGLDEQKRLACLFRELVQRGVYCVESNSDSPVTRELYADFPTVEISARRSINADATKRGAIGELVILGVPQGWREEVSDIFDVLGFLDN